MDATAAEVHAVAVSTHHVAAAGNLSGDDHLLLGVAASTARFLQLDAAVVRLAFTGAALAAPPVVLAYPLAYLCLRGRRVRAWAPLAGADSRSARGTLGVLAVELAVVLAARGLGWTLPDPVVVTLLVCQAALALGFRRLDRTERWSWLLGPGRAGPGCASAGSRSAATRSASPSASRPSCSRSTSSRAAGSRGR